MEPSISNPISTSSSTRGGWKHLAPNDPTGKLRRTPRMLSILYDLFDNEWLHSGHVKALDPFEKSDRLLYRMAQHRTITRLDADWGWEPPSSGGSAPLLYELAERGAYDLARFGLISTEQWREWDRERKARDLKRAANQDRKPTLLPHQIANADVLVWLAQGCAARGYGLERGHQLMHGRSPRSLIIPGRSRPLVTDCTLRIEGGARRCVLFIETDRGTEPYVRHDKNELKSIERMIKGYLAYAGSDLLPLEFDVEPDAWLQLTVTTGDEKRVEGIARTAQAAGASGEHFLVTNFEMLALADPFAASWMQPDGSLARLAL